MKSCMTHCDSMARVERFAKELGGKFKMVKVIDRLARNISIAPFTSCLAIDYSKKTLYVSRDYNSIGAEVVGGTIHELAHIFACKDGPYRCREFPFLGWEYAAAIRLGLLWAWDLNMETYLIHGETWADLHATEKCRVIDQRVKVAIESKLITKGLTPRSVR